MILISLLGQTCSGKSQMSVDLAHKLGKAWIVNCDSRQVYSRLDIGTAKVAGTWIDGVYMYQSIPHFLIDYIDPGIKVSIVDYASDFVKLLSKADSLPQYVIITGGTGLYAKAIIDQYQFGLIKSEHLSEYDDLKVSLQSKTVAELQNLLTEHELDESGFYNPPRLINALLKQHASAHFWTQDITYPKFERTISVAILANQDELKDRIINRIYERLENGLVDEVEGLQGLGTERLLDLGLEYRITQLYLLGQFNRDEYIDKLIQENWRYAKRQMTWLKKQPLDWISDATEILKLTSH
jgi:tRNA dimethylallyltransferase